MTASLPPEVQQVFDRFTTTAYTTIDPRGQPITTAASPSYRPGDPCIDVAAGEAPANPRVALLFCDAAGSGIEPAPQVLVQGIAEGGEPSVSVRPERVYVWPRGDATSEPRLFDAHMEEVRSGHVEEPPGELPAPEGGAGAWDERLERLAGRDRRAVLALVAPDGFPFSVRLGVELDREQRRVRIGAGALGVPAQPGLACLTAGGVQATGDLVDDDDAWALVPHGLREFPRT